MSPDETPEFESSWQQAWRTIGTELVEIAWLASTIGALSVAGVGLAVLLAGV
jgi:hypothetical protein